MTLKIALVGTGNVAKRNYVPCLSYQEDVELGYYNRTRTKAEAIAEEFGGAVFDSLEALTAWNPDSIFVLTRETERRAVIAALLALKPRGYSAKNPSSPNTARQTSAQRTSSPPATYSNKPPRKTARRQ